ncbi:MAG: hypothetical protein Q8R90_06175 [Bacteroidales bacterium]|nr:hypothetical protein [Bacteroidales bacterium]MDZ4059313.1 hypothetical protein [Bacteroidales bacterium]
MVIAVDFDGTIVKHRFPEIGEEIPFAIDTLKLIQSELKHTLILWTVREGDLLGEAVAFCKERGLQFYAVNQNNPEDSVDFGPRKLMADLFIDDRNFGGLPDWGFIFNTLKERPESCFSTEIFITQPQEVKQKRKGFFR